MRIQKHLPSAPLSSYIKEYMLIESDADMFSNTLPDTAMVMAFRYRGAVLKTENGKNDLLPVSSSAGLRKSARQFAYVKNTTNLLVIFKEGGFAAFTTIPANELFNLAISNDNIFPANELNEIQELLAEAKSDNLRINIIETFLFDKLRNKKQDALVLQAITIIKQQNGILRIKELASTLNISQDPFEKRFRAIVGATPKQFASIVRLRNLIQKYPSHNSLTEASYEAGYFDQSHFIKDFRLFTGKSPKEFLKGGEFW